MIFGKNAGLMLKYQKAKAKMVEYDVSKQEYPHFPLNSNELSYPTTYVLSRYSECIIENNHDELKELELLLITTAEYYDSAFKSKDRPEYDWDFLLSGASAYFLRKDFGSAKVLAARVVDLIDEERSPQKLLTNIYNYLLGGVYLPYLRVIDTYERINNFFLDYFGKGKSLEALKSNLWVYRNEIYENGDPDSIFYVDILVAVIIVACENSSWSLLPSSSGILDEEWESYLQSKMSIKMLWPAQRLIAEKGLLRGESSIVQLPTGVGKTRSIELIIRAAFLSERANIAIIVAPLRALCNEITMDMYKAFGNDVTINQFSDVLQNDFWNLFSEDIKRQILICTPEKLSYVLHHDPFFLSAIDLFVFDEGHMFDDGGRGATYELLVTHIRQNITSEQQLVLLSAVLPNSGDIAQWLFEDRGCLATDDSIVSTPKSIGFSSTQRDIHFFSDDKSNEDYYIPRILRVEQLKKLPRERSNKYFPDLSLSTDVAIYNAIKLCHNGGVAIYLGQQRSMKTVFERIINLDRRNYDLKALKDNTNQIKNVEKGIIVSYTIIFVSVILSIITGTYNNTYTTYGITGWFSSANTQSMILTVISPLFIYFCSKKESYKYFIAMAMFFILLYFNGTKACYYTLIFSLIVMLYVLIFKKENKPTKVIITLAFLVGCLCIYNVSFTSDRNQEVDNTIKSNDEAIIKLLEKGNLSKQETINILRTSYLFEEAMDDLGEDAVYNEMKDKVTLYNLGDNRLIKRIYGKVVFKNSDTLTKLVGINHKVISDYGRDLENDITAIFYYYGYIGFALYIIFILSFAILGIKVLIKKPIKLFSPRFIVLTFTILLSLFGGEYSGALLRKTNANIYLSIVFALYYVYLIYSDNNDNFKININNNKMSFLLLHLGYGGIESSTINTANSLCDKYDIEIMSFYKLDKNQANKLNDKIKIKYLYDGGPNKEEFLNAMHKHKFIKALKEGIKASDILIKKKIKVIKYIINCDAKYVISTRWEFSILLSRYGNNYSVKIAQEHHYHNNNNKYINVLKYKYNNIDYLFALTKTLEKDYKDFLKGNNDHTKVVLMPNMLYEIPNKESKLKDRNIITVSRLDEGKKIDDIIRAFSKLKEKDWKLYVIGDGKEYNNLNSLIDELELKDRVILTGYKNKEEIEKYMLESSLFLMASVSEGLPMVLLEAMSYGIPCIAYHTDSGTDDIIKDNKNGYIINNRNEKEYINKIEKVIKDDKLRIKLGKEAKSTAYDFSKEKITEKWLKILNK